MSAVLYLDRHGVKVGASQGRLTLKATGEEEQTLPLHQVEQVIVLAHAHFSHDAIAMLLREGIPVIFSALRGGYRGTLAGRPGRQIMRRKRQYQAMDDPRPVPDRRRRAGAGQAARPRPAAAAMGHTHAARDR
jgi:CRISPR/Cas system-associated endonuclease Cas1